ncbi:hypothetical protein AB5I41_05755 [Sphingomonas sp. MMS24-JH45]
MAAVSDLFGRAAADGPLHGLVEFGLLVRGRSARGDRPGARGATARDQLRRARAAGRGAGEAGRGGRGGQPARPEARQSEPRLFSYSLANMRWRARRR